MKTMLRYALQISAGLGIYMVVTAMVLGAQIPRLPNWVGRNGWWWRIHLLQTAFFSASDRSGSCREPVHACASILLLDRFSATGVYAHEKSDWRDQTQRSPQLRISTPVM